MFNSIAGEWKATNPQARNDRRARELREVLCNLHGVDINPTACRITAFSLYLAYLDQLAPRDIQELQKKGRALPNLISKPTSTVSAHKRTNGNIKCVDFFKLGNDVPTQFFLVVGNPPWGSIAADDTPAGR